MNSYWKYTIKLLVRAFIVAAIMMPIAYFLSVRPVILILAIATLIGLWRKRTQLPSIINRAKVIIAVVFGTALFFAFLLWYIYGDMGSSLGLVLATAAVIAMTVGLYGSEIPSATEEDVSSFTIEDEILALKEQQACPNCGVVIPQNAKLCSWCGESLYPSSHR